jgi:hypothetical protein
VFKFDCLCGHCAQPNLFTGIKKPIPTLKKNVKNEVQEISTMNNKLPEILQLLYNQ